MEAFRLILKYPELLSLSILFSMWILIFRPRMKEIPFGILAYTLSLIIEYEALPVGEGWEMILIAPVVETFSILIFNITRDRRGGTSSGLGFAIMENASYFASFATSPILLTVIIIRSLSDTMLHVTGGSLSSFSYSGKGRMRFGLLYAMGIHSLFNLTVMVFSIGIESYLILATWFLAMSGIMAYIVSREKTSRKSKVILYVHALKSGLK